MCLDPGALLARFGPPAGLFFAFFYSDIQHLVVLGCQPADAAVSVAVAKSSRLVMIMVLRVIRVICGFLLACLAAGITFVLFVQAPLTAVEFSEFLTTDHLARTSLLMLAAATHCALYAAPFALLLLTFAEAQHVRSWFIYALFGVVVSLSGLMVQHLATPETHGAILNQHALTAFVAAGLIAGFTYWFFAGDRAGLAGAAAAAHQPTGTPARQSSAADDDAPTIASPVFTPPKSRALMDALEAANADDVDTKIMADVEDNEKRPPELDEDGMDDDDGVDAEKFVIHTNGVDLKSHRLVASEELSEDDFSAIAEKLGKKPVKARKIGFVAARVAEETQEVETKWQGSETTNTASPGDLIVTNLTPTRSVVRDAQGYENTYVIDADKFDDLYEETGDENEFGDIYKAKGVVSAIYFSDGFEIVAPWGEKQTAKSGYLLSNNGDIYGNHKDTFERTYEVIDEPVD